MTGRCAGTSWPAGSWRRCTAAAAAGWLFVLCGPALMLKAAPMALLGLGVPGARILAERFIYD